MNNMKYDKLIKSISELIQTTANNGNVYCEMPSASNSIDTEMGKMMQIKNQKEVDRIVLGIKSDLQEEELMEQKKKMLSLKQKLARKKKKIKILKKQNEMLQNELGDIEYELKEMSNKISKLKKENKQLRKIMRPRLNFKSKPYQIPTRKEVIIDVNDDELEGRNR